MPEKRSALVVGAGDATGGAIARRFAREGYATVVTRRELASLEPLLSQIRAEGGEAHGFGADARDEDQTVALFETIEAEIAPLEAVIFNIGANVNFPIRETTSRVYRKVWEMAAFAGFLAGRERRRRWFRGARARSSSPGRPRRSAGRQASRLSRAPSSRSARWRRPWRVSWGRRACMWRTRSSTARSTRNGSPRISPQRHALKEQDGILNPNTSRMRTGCCTPSRAMRGRMSSTCVHGWRKMA